MRVLLYLTPNPARVWKFDTDRRDVRKAQKWTWST